MDADRLHGFFEPLTRYPSAVGSATTDGSRMFWSVRPSAQPEASSSRSPAMPASILCCAGVSRSAVAARLNSIATVKWCMVATTPSDGLADANPRSTRTASSGLAAAPPNSSGASRPGAPCVRNSSTIGLSGASRAVSGSSSSAASRPGWNRSHAARATVWDRMSSPWDQGLGTEGSPLSNTAARGLTPGAAMLTPCRCEVLTIG